ncbi:MAG: class I SAM-dependent methyltransferase [Terriglobia bacterium]
MINRLPLLNDWRQRHIGAPYFNNRFQLYDYLSTEIIGSNPITYLEFGVWEGESIRYWMGLNRNPASEFTGFDTFEGLPEVWHRYVGKMDKGHFCTKGEPPKCDDKRARFVKGLFQETLPKFLESFNRQNQIVINNDSDLYSSTLYTLCSLHPFMRAGTVVILDEFSQVLDEFRALEDYCTSFMRTYEVLGASGQYYDRVAIRFVK